MSRELSPRPSIAVVGGGPAGLMAAERAALGGAQVVVYDRMPSPGRKLLLAGRGGLNLTHSEDPARFVERYGSAAARLRPFLARFGPDDLRTWCTTLGIETFVGTSGRVFPQALKTSPLLRAWLRRLDGQGIELHQRHRWLGWDTSGDLRFETLDGERTIAVDATILALGGASWPHLGSDGSWTDAFVASGIVPTKLQPANCGCVVDWTQAYRDRFEGQPLKAVAVCFGGERMRGDIVVTRSGLEGGPIYALAPHLRAATEAHGEAVVEVALRPDLDSGAIAQKIARKRTKDSISSALRRTLGLSPQAIGLLHESCVQDGRSLSALDGPAMARLVNAVTVRIKTPMPIARAISTAGGVAFADVDDQLMLDGRPGTFVAGEMLDWEAPTGGYLLQACFSTGIAAAEGALRWLEERRRDIGRRAPQLKDEGQ